MSMELLNLYLFSILLLSLFIIFYASFSNIISKSIGKNSKTSSKSINKIEMPKSFPIIGSYFSICANRDRIVQWTAELIMSSPSATFILHHPFDHPVVLTGNPANVKYILQSNFYNYKKGDVFKTILKDIAGNGIFNVDAELWKLQRQISSYEFSSKSLHKFLEMVIDKELNDRLIPILSNAVENGMILDMQDILQRFGFDNICKIAFNYDPAYLLPSLPEAELAKAFDDALKIAYQRFVSFPLIWKLKRFLGIGSEKRLKVAISEVRRLARRIIREKRQEFNQKLNIDSADLLSRFLILSHSSPSLNDDLIIDIVLSFILAGRDSTSAALTWYFWLLHKNPHVEERVLKEVKEKSEAPIYDEVKDMVYTHASLCESMRLYPPVPWNGKQAVNDDVLADGTIIKKGMGVAYHPYAMGRLEELWGSDWEEFKPERWLEKDAFGEWTFVGRDSFTYPVFQAGPRTCLGKEMAFLQMKRVVAGVLRRFKVVSAIEEGKEPVLVSHFVAKMQGGFPVRIVARNEQQQLTTVRSGYLN